MCDAMEAYSRACMDKGVRLNWRSQGRCGKHLRAEILVIVKEKLLFSCSVLAVHDDRTAQLRKLSI